MSLEGDPEVCRSPCPALLATPAITTTNQSNCLTSISCIRWCSSHSAPFFLSPRTSSRASRHPRCQHITSRYTSTCSMLIGRGTWRTSLAASASVFGSGAMMGSWMTMRREWPGRSGSARSARRSRHSRCVRDRQAALQLAAVLIGCVFHLPSMSRTATRTAMTRTTIYRRTRARARRTSLTRRTDPRTRMASGDPNAGARWTSQGMLVARKGAFCRRHIRR